LSFDHVVVKSVEGERRIDAADLPIRIGTAADSDIRLPGPGGSPVLQLDLLDGVPFVQPLGRSATVLLNDEPLSTSSRLRDGDRLHYFGSDIRIHAGDVLRLDVQLEGSAYITQAPELPDVAAEDELITATAFTRAADAPAPAQVESGGPPIRAILGSLLLVLAVASYLIFTARSVQFTVTPGPADDLEIVGAWFQLPIGDRVLMRPGTYSVIAQKAGYYENTQTFDIGDESTKTVEIALRPLPGQLVVVTDATDEVIVTVDGSTIGPAPLGPVELQPGEHSIEVQAERYLPFTDIVSIAGLGRETIVDVQLVPRWAEVEISSEPSAARVYDGETLLGETPLTAELLEGTHELSIVKDGFSAWDGSVVALPNTPQTLPMVELQPANAKLLVQTIPRGANVTVNGRYRGQSPLTLDLAPDVDFRIGLSKAGYGNATRPVRLSAAASDSITVDLSARTGKVTLNVAPADAVIYVDGRARGRGSRTLDLTAAPHKIEVRLDGYESWSRTLTPRPGYPQTVTASLRSLEAIRQASIVREITTSQDATLVRVEPGRFQLGSSRSEPGRRANEVIVPAEITKPFFIGAKEVTNKEFRAFRASHDSGADVHVSMAGDNNPVANVTWEDAVQFCNWLSREEGLTPAYKEEFGKWVPIYPWPNGYRLPTEAEWAWSMRYSGQPQAPRFNWGSDWPPPEGAGNFADQSSLSVTSSQIPRYDDGFTSTAPVGRFRANLLGIYDVGGNVAEWVNDIYAIPTPGQTTVQTDPTGPTRGNEYVIRGSGWRSALQGELRLSYRDSGAGARDDVGFRLARNVE